MTAPDHHPGHRPGTAHPAYSPATRRTLLVPLIRREVAARYRGSVLGIVWSLLTPLFMLGVYTFVFGAVFRARWAGAGSGTVAEFAVILFAGLIVFQLYSEVVNRAPTLILSNQNLVKKVIFPLDLFAPVALGSALFHAIVSLAVLVVFVIAVFGSLPWTALLAPLVLAPLCLFILGIAWFLASLGTYLRDIGQVVGTLVTAQLFLSPIFFPLSALPQWLQPWLLANPISLPVEQLRQVLIFGVLPDLAQLAVYCGVAAAVAWLGHAWFQATRKGFADVL